MSNKIAVVGVNGNTIAFDFNEKLVYLFRKGWASQTLKLVDIAIPFDKITAIELVEPTTWQAGRIALIVDGIRLLAEDQFDNNASELSVGTKMYPAIKAAVDRLCAECPNIQLTDAALAVPAEKIQQTYATTVTCDAFMKTGEKPAVTKSDSVSVGGLIVIAAIITICAIVIGIILINKLYGV